MKFNAISFILLVLIFLHSCKENKQELTLNEKITQAIASRKIPDQNDQKAAFNASDWIRESGPHNTEIYCHLEDYLPTVLIERGTGEIKNLPENNSNELGQKIISAPLIPEGTTLNQICDTKKIDGIIILHKGEIVYEKYPDMDPADRHFAASVSKAILGTIIARLADEGKLDEQDPIGKYLVEFKDKPLENVSIESVLRMASGINCHDSREAFTDPFSCFYKLMQYSALFPEPEYGFDVSLMNMLADAGSVKAPGLTYDYSSANSLILSTIAERISGEPYHKLVEEYIWSKIGAEDDARITFSSHGVPGSHGTMLMRLRDLARFGLAFTKDASYQIASERYLSELRRGDRDLFRSEGGLGQLMFLSYFEGQGADFQSYHWDVVFDDRDFAKFGSGGQGLYISPDKRLVIAFYSSRKNDSGESFVLMYLARSLALLDSFIS